MQGCANCNAQLNTIENELGSYLNCPQCQSIYIDYLTFINSSVKNKFLRDCLKAAKKDKTRNGVICPECQKPMSIQQDEITHGQIQTCPECEKFWFKHDQMRLFPQKEESVKPLKESNCKSIFGKPEKEKESKELVEEAVAKEWDSLKTTLDGASISTTTNIYSRLSGLFFLPIRESGTALKRFPLICWGLVGLFFIIYGMSHYEPLNAISSFGFIPLFWKSSGILRVFSAFPLHLNFLHFFLNSYYLILFGTTVEDHLGRFRFILLLLGAQLAGFALHTLANPTSDIPMIGASAAVSGIITFYCFTFPNRKISWVTHYLFIFLKFEFKAWQVFPICLLFQFLLSFLRVDGVSYISSHAYLGGAIFGIVATMTSQVRKWYRAIA